MIGAGDRITLFEAGGGDAPAWDAGVRELGGNLVQSWAWGELERRHGGAGVSRLRVDTATGSGMAQILFRQVGPVTLANIDEGPLLSADDVATARQLFAAIDRECARQRALVLRVEPDQAVPTVHLHGPPFTPPPRLRASSRTLKVPLLDDEALLAQMRKQTRRYIRLGQRHGVEVQAVSRPEAASPELAIFYELLAETSTRNQFPIRPYDYYADAIQTLGDNAAILVARVDGVPAAAEAVVTFGAEAASLWAASSTAHRTYGTAAYLLFESMRWARGLGCTRYDLWGLPPDPAPAAAGGAPPSRGASQSGLYRFKVGFGGNIIEYPPAQERRYRPYLLQSLRSLRDARRFLPN